ANATPTATRPARPAFSARMARRFELLQRFAVVVPVDARADHEKLVVAVSRRPPQADFGVLRVAIERRAVGEAGADVRRQPVPEDRRAGGPAHAHRRRAVAARPPARRL